MNKEIALNKNQFSLVPRTLDEAIKYAEIISNTALVPNNYKGKPGDIVVAMQMGSELGLLPMQALQSIAVINGRPSIWGDAALAICQNHPKWEYIHEEIHQDQEGNHRAHCTIKRKGEEEYVAVFSVNDAKKSGLWGKSGPWTQYPKRMLQLRARGFALRDKFADALKGLITREEAMDYPAERVIKCQEKEYVSKADKIADLIDIDTGEVLDPVVEHEEIEQDEDND